LDKLVVSQPAMPFLGFYVIHKIHYWIHKNPILTLST